MQMRFDGHIGFPGGLIDEGESPWGAVSRECFEELGWRANITADDFLFAHAHEPNRLLTFFFAKELSEETLTNV